MTSYEMTPTDTLTGVPYCLLPPASTDIDTNHQMFHADEPEFQTVGGKAVRQSRVQEVDRIDHIIFHQRFDWIKTPKNPDQQLGYLAFICAGYIPPFAINLRRKNPWVQRLEEDEITQLRSGQVRVHNQRALGEFFIDYTNSQDLSSSSYIDEFLNTGSIVRRRKLASALIYETIQDAVEPLSRKFKQAKRKGTMTVNSFDHLPFLMASTVIEADRDKFTNSLWSRLTQEALQTGVDEAELQAA